MEPKKYKIVFTFIVEFGDLENKSLLLAKSLRRFYKDANEYPIYAVRPRRGKEIKNSTKEQFKALDVIYIYSPVNRSWESHPHINQVYGPALIEELIYGKTEFMVYLDADIVCLNLPSELSLPDNCLIGITPADIGNGKGGDDAAIAAEDPLTITWKFAYNLVGIKSIPKWTVTTKVNKLTIHPYFNSGFSIVRPEAKIFGLCKDMFEMASKRNDFDYLNSNIKLFSSDFLYKSGIFWLDQIFLSAAILSKCSEHQIKIFGNEYNFPLNFVKEITGGTYNLENVIFLHYHNMFYDLKWQSNVHLDTKAKEWLTDKIPIKLPRKHVSYRIKMHVKFGITFIKWHLREIKHKTESD
ncbi:hypothetical protein [Ferroplasma acidiphilum]|uniref:hypothetical protein n=1 Tax=Ferroplasma acidiphilum TaxID=74969 RepID=UPI0028159E1A|nr:hypothetical protein [Ferroplasma acidiphilum]WMT53768.1 MAG: hypothetical protein RE473_02710 [Ferroplasma acidiphilum]